MAIGWSMWTQFPLVPRPRSHHCEGIVRALEAKNGLPEGTISNPEEPVSEPLMRAIVVQWFVMLGFKQSSVQVGIIKEYDGVPDFAQVLTKDATLNAQVFWLHYQQGRWSGIRKWGTDEREDARQERKRIQREYEALGCDPHASPVVTTIPTTNK